MSCIISNKIKLSYTKDMKEQDKLWEKAKEDRNKMAILQNKILSQATKLGWTGNFYQYMYDTNDNIESLVDIYYEKDKKDCQTFGNCKYLIEHLEYLLNFKTEYC